MTTVDQPDAVTRFPENTTPFALSAFYFGELAVSPDETTAYAAPTSPNFPRGGQLTTGDGDAPVAPSDARADFDGDGKTDLSVFRPTNGDWYLLRSTEGFSAVNWGVSTDVLVPGDYDGDNKTDTAVRRGGDWLILQSTNNTFRSIGWGVSTDIPVAEDYDGDNKTDAAVFRDSNSTWYILNSNGGTQFTSWGQTGDVPVTGDFDGDGKDDQAVYRNGTWYLNRSTSGFGAAGFGVASDKPVPNEYLP